MAFVRPITRLKAQSSSVAGTSQRTVAGTGVAVSQDAVVAGFSARVVDGSGILTSGDSSASGGGSVSNLSIDTIPNITLAVGETHDMDQYINDPLGQIASTEVTGLLGYASYSDATRLLTGVSEGSETGVQLVADPVDLIDLAVKRYDGGSGVATFNGVAHFQPGQLTDAGQLSIWNGGTELPIYVNVLSGLHADSSIKAVQIQTELSVSDSTPIGLSLKTNVAPSAGTVTPIDPDLSWAQNMTLLYCTDATHMCASRVTPLPLVPLDDPNMPADTATFLTTGFDAWLASMPAIATALYNWVYGYICRYLCTGDGDALEDAVRRCLDPAEICYGNIDFDNGFMPTPSTHRVDGALFSSFPSGNWPDAYGDYASGYSANGRFPEWNSIAQDMWMVYYTTGSETARRLIVFHANTQWASSVQNVTSTIYETRFSYRWRWSESMLAQLLGATESIAYAGSAVMPNPQTGDFSVKIQQQQDRAEAWNPAEFRYGIWGSSPYTNDDVGVGNQPLFQYEVMLWPNLSYYNLIDADSRIGPAMALMSEYVRDQTYGPGADPLAGPWTGHDGRECYAAPYVETDPAGLGNEADPASSNVELAMMNMHTIIWKYAYDGDTDHRDVWDVMTQYATPSLAAPDGSTGANTAKLTGQIYSMAYHGAAWRAGAPALGY